MSAVNGQYSFRNFAPEVLCGWLGKLRGTVQITRYGDLTLGANLYSGLLSRCVLVLHSSRRPKLLRPLGVRRLLARKNIAATNI